MRWAKSATQPLLFCIILIVVGQAHAENIQRPYAKFEVAFLNVGLAHASVKGYTSPIVFEPIALQYNITKNVGFIIRNRVYQNFLTTMAPSPVAMKIEGYSYGISLQMHLASTIIPFVRYEKFLWNLKATGYGTVLGRQSGTSPMYSTGVQFLLGHSNLALSLQYLYTQSLSDTDIREATVGFVYHF